MFLLTIFSVINLIFNLFYTITLEEIRKLINDLLHGRAKFIMAGRDLKLIMGILRED